MHGFFYVVLLNYSVIPLPPNFASAVHPDFNDFRMAEIRCVVADYERSPF